MKKNSGGGKKKSQNVHMNVLRDSEKDTVGLCFAVNERFAELLNTWLRMNGEFLVPPTHLDRDMALWREMMFRFRKLDYRNTDDELRSLKRIAQWTVDMKTQMTNSPKKTVEWKDS